MVNKFVIYKSFGEYSGAVEVRSGFWPFQKIQHAPVYSAASAENVFLELRRRYPNDIIEFNENLYSDGGER